MPSAACLHVTAADTKDRAEWDRSRPLAHAWRCLRLGGAALVLASAALFPAAAAAAPPWYEHYRRGLELEQQGAWQSAVAELSAAIRGQWAPRELVKLPGGGVIAGYDPHFHIARCMTELGRYRDAAVHLAIAFRAGVTSRDRLIALRERLEAAVSGTTPPRPIGPVAQLRVESEPAGATLTIDGVARGDTPAGPLPLPAGAHRFRLEAPGRETVDQTVELAGGPNTVSFSLRELPPPLPTRAPLPTLPTREDVAAKTAVAAAVSEAPTAPPPTIAASPTAAPRRRRAAVALVVLPFALLFIAAAGVWLLRRRRFHPQTLPAAGRAGLEPTLPSTGFAGVKNYAVTGVLGRGGMATTYRARRETDGATVALKVPHETCLADETFVARFLREGALGEQLHHPCIVRIFEAGEADGKPFMAMELVFGSTLKQVLREGGALPQRRALEIARSIAEALDYAHAKGVIHRDLKPENVMITDDGTVKVMDFGIARLAGQEGLTMTGLFLGTPLYAAPEMMEPTSIDHRVDLYALGIILYEMLEGTVPFSADSPYRVLEMHRQRPLPAGDELPRAVPPVVWRIIERLCAKQPEARFPSAQALLVELNRLLHGPDDPRGSDVF
jgi:hypothetical protein